MDEIIVSTTTQMGISTDLIRAIVTVESNWNPWALRFEPAVYASQTYLITPSEYASKLLISTETEKVCQSCSFGPMQVMGFLARQLGFQFELTKLLQPEIGIQYGCLQIKKLLQKYGDEQDAIAAYNAGSPRKTSGGLYMNEQYVDKVSNRLRALRAISS